MLGACKINHPPNLLLNLNHLACDHSVKSHVPLSVIDIKYVESLDGVQTLENSQLNTYTTAMSDVKAYLKWNVIILPVCF